jgi:DNA invertase Pin-like site-specific DNA recombinase
MIAAVYARKSTDQSGVSDDQKSVARQIDHAGQYAARKGWTIADEHVYVDDGISGAEFSNRPGFVRLMNALKPRAPFDILIMSEVSRLGREQIETAYALKQLSQAGARCFSYLEDRELLIESATDKFLLGAVTFAADLEREKARQRTYDAMQRKARAGHVTGGWTFGYRNIEIVGTDGRRSHVEREIEPAQADVIRQIFQLSADGHGVKAIAKRLNAQGAPSPRAQQGRSQSWAPSSVRAVLYRPLYRGEITWNQTRKRDTWGHTHQAGRPEADWIRVAAPSLRIISDELWARAHVRLVAVRGVYMKATNGRPFGRPPLGDPSKYLLTNFASCGQCGGTLKVRSRKHGKGRAFYYGCAGYHERGKTVCTNNADVPMMDADNIVVEALLDDVLDPSMIQDAVEEALQLLRGDDRNDRVEQLDAELATINKERARLVTAIATGGELGGLLDALRTRDRRREDLEAHRAALRSQRRLQASDTDRVRDELMTLAGTWRKVLVDDPMHARPIMSELLVGRSKFTPVARNCWSVRGEGHLTGLFAKVLFPLGSNPVGDAIRTENTRVNNPDNDVLHRSASIDQSRPVHTSRPR